MGVRILHNAFDGLKDAFSRPAYALIGLVAAAVSAAGAAWAVNARVIVFLLSSSRLPAAVTFRAVLAQLVGTFSLFQPAQVAMIAAAALLFGLNVAIAACYAHRRYAFGRSMGLSLAGALIALLGVGCLSCGSVVLLALFGSVVGTEVIRRLPFGGLEFGFVGCAAMLASALLAAARIPHAASCALPVRRRPS